MQQSQTYEICRVPDYSIKYEKTKKFSNQDINIISNLLEKDLSLHERLYKSDTLKLFLDIDRFENGHTLDLLFSHICEFLNITENEISYTTNSSKVVSHHIVIPKYFMPNKNQKIMWCEFAKKYSYSTKEIDVAILDKDQWFRLPNQTKQSVSGTEHKIIRGVKKDFIKKYISDSTLFEYSPTSAPTSAPTSVPTILRHRFEHSSR